MIGETKFPFLAEKGHVVSLVGGGGKTTLLYAMAAYCAGKGWHVLVTTTTHIMQPPGGVWAQTDEQLEALWANGCYAVAGAAAPNQKLTIPPAGQLKCWMNRADLVLVEADGAKRMPCKVPAEHEPVLLPQSDIVLAVAGLSALGRPICEVCFRVPLALQLLGAEPGDVLTPEYLAALLASENGGRKLVQNRTFYVVLNQADTLQRQKLGEKTLELLAQHRIQGVLTCFEEKERA